MVVSTILTGVSSVMPIPFRGGPGLEMNTCIIYTVVHSTHVELVLVLSSVSILRIYFILVDYLLFMYFVFCFLPTSSSVLICFV